MTAITLLDANNRSSQLFEGILSRFYYNGGRAANSSLTGQHGVEEAVQHANENGPGKAHPEAGPIRCRLTCETIHDK